MVSYFFFILLLFYKSKCVIINNDFRHSLNDDDIIRIEPGLSENHFINYKKGSNFYFNIKNNNILQISIHAINCNIKIDYIGEMLDKKNLDTYSLQINSTNNIITITPLIDISHGEYKENYDKKSCPLIINSFLVNDKNPTLKIKNKEENNIYLNPLTYNKLNISYDIKEVSGDSFVALYFKFYEKSNFLIDINYMNADGESNSLTKNIGETNNIFLNSEFLLYDEKSKIGGNLFITIDNIEHKAIHIDLKIIEKESISILEKDALNRRRRRINAT